MEKRKAFLVYVDIRKNLELLSDDEAGKVFKALVKYGEDGTLPKFDDRAITVFVNSIVDQMERDQKRYSERCEKARKSQQIRWERLREKSSANDTDEYERIQSNTNGTDNDIDIDDDIENDTDKDNEERESKRDSASCGFSSDSFMKWYNGQIQYTDLPKLTKMTEKRVAALSGIIDEFGKNAIAAVMSKVVDSDYLCGNTYKKFKANFDWLFKRDNFIKVYEGQYDN